MKKEFNLNSKIEETIDYYEGCNDLSSLKRDIIKDVKEFIKIIDKNSIKLNAKNYFKKANEMIKEKKDIRLVDFTELKERAGDKLK